MTLPRIVVTLLLALVVVTAVALLLFSAGGEAPGQGRGDSVRATGLVH